MIFLRQAHRVLLESYRFVSRNPKAAGASVLKLWFAYSSMLFFHTVMLNISQAASVLWSAPHLSVVVRGTTPGIAVFGERFSSVPGVRTVRFELSETLTSSSLDGPLPEALPLFAVWPNTLHPDTFAVVSSRVRSIDGVLDVLYSRDLVTCTADLLVWIQRSRAALYVVVGLLVVGIVIRNARLFVEKRESATLVMTRMGATRWFIVVQAAVWGTWNGLLAVSLALGCVLWGRTVLLSTLNPVHAPDLSELMILLVAGSLIAGFANSSIMLVASGLAQSEEGAHDRWL